MANIITTLALEMNANWYVSKKLNSIGRVGENTVTKLTIEPTEILDNVTYELEIMSASGSKNVAELTIDGTELYLILTANMLTTSGITKMQVRGLFTDGSIKKSNIFELKVNRSISATDYYEEYAVTIFDQLVNECRDIIEGAESYAIRAETAAVNAEAYEQSASASAETASASASTASASAETATTAAETATAASVSASTSAETASTAAASASASANTAQTSAQTATSASTAAQSASETAQTASTTATTAATNAETAANTATTAANNASTSATSAATSASNAAISETNASTSAANASTSETNAASSATSAANSATSASTSATNAANSAIAAATSATNAHTSEVNASTSETNASASATEAAETAESIAASVAQINENTYRINDLEAIIAGYQLTDLPTGAIATVADGTALLMPSLKVGIEPVQDLHGYDHPWAGGAGKNLFDIDAEHTVVNETYMYEVYVEANTSYTLSSNCPYSSPANLYFNGGSSETNGVGTGYSKTFSSDENGKLTIYVRKIANNPSIDLYTAVKNGQYYIQLEEGSTATSYSPYSNICPISGWTAANVSVKGINVWDEEWELGIYSVGNGNKIDISTRIRTKNPIYVIPNMVYNKIAPTNGFQYLLFYDKDMNFIQTKKTGAGNQTFGVPANAVFMHAYTENESYGTTYNHDMGINYPSTDTDYHAYVGTTYNIQFKDGDNPLTVYGGTLDVTTGELVVDRAMITIDGSAGNISRVNTNRFNIDNLISGYKRAVDYSSGICSIYKSLPQRAGNAIFDTDAINYNACYDLSSQFETIRIKDIRYDTVNDFTAILAVEKPTILYELATPITYHLTPTQIRTLVGTNNIWADTGDVLSGKYYRSPF